MGRFGAAAAAGIVEGDYTSWTFKWLKHLDKSCAGACEASQFIDEKNNVVVVAWEDEDANVRFGIYTIEDLTTIFQSDRGSNYIPGIGGYVPSTRYYRGMQFGAAFGPFSGISRSIQSYVLLLRLDLSTIEVWRGGSTPLWSKDVPGETGCDDIGNVEISPTGKYLLLKSEWDELILYEGG